MDSGPLVDEVRVDAPAAGTGCVVVAMVPHPTDAALLLCAEAVDEHDQRDELVRLPSIETGPEPRITAIVQSFAEMLHSPVTPLRANEVAWHKNFDPAAMITELEPVTSQVPDGWCWRPVDESTIDSVSPQWAREPVGSWLRERTVGWADRRPQWSRPGWLALATSWMREQMEVAGFVDPMAPQVHHLWGVSVVLRAESATGTAYLKCSGGRFRHEATLTRALATHSPMLLPDVVAVEPERGWLLMRDLGAPELGDQAESSWGTGLDALVHLQQMWLGRTDELVALGVESRPLTHLATWLGDTIHNIELLGLLTPDERRLWLSAVPAMVDSCERLRELGLGESLVHGDFHPWNVVSGPDGARIFDWTDASVAHPVLDVVTYIMRSPDPELRRSMLRRYLDAWSTQVPEAGLREMGHLALVVGALHQAHTYSRLIPTIHPDDLGQLRAGDAHWIRRALRFAEHGLESAY